MPLDIYSAMIGEPPSDQEKTEALAAKLRGRSLLGNLGMLTGDKVLSPMGEQIGQQTEAQAAKIANRALVTQQLNRSDDLARMKNEFDLGQLGKEQDFNKGEHALDRAMQLEIARIRAQQDSDAEARANARLTAAETKALNQQTRALSADLQKANIPFLDSAYTALDTATKPFKGLDGKLKLEGLPGTGATGQVPFGLLSKEGREVRQSVANIRNQFLKMASGAAVTDPEAARTYEVIGNLLGGTDEDIMHGMEMIRDMKDTAKTNIYSGYDDEAIVEFSRRKNRGGAPAPVGIPEGGAGPVKRPEDYGSYEEYLEAGGGE